MVVLTTGYHLGELKPIIAQHSRKATRTDLIRALAFKGESRAGLIDAAPAGREVIARIAILVIVAVLASGCDVLDDTFDEVQKEHGVDLRNPVDAATAVSGAEATGYKDAADGLKANKADLLRWAQEARARSR